MCGSMPPKSYVRGSVPRRRFQSSFVSDVLNGAELPFEKFVGSSVKSCHGTPPMSAKNTRSDVRGPRGSLQSSCPGPVGRVAAKSGFVQFALPT
jgi:hypothetical protein